MREETITGESEECGRHKPTMETNINHKKQQEEVSVAVVAKYCDQDHGEAGM